LKINVSILKMVLGEILIKYRMAVQCNSGEFFTEVQASNPLRNM
jgi:hypothetical protein